MKRLLIFLLAAFLLAGAAGAEDGAGVNMPETDGEGFLADRDGAPFVQEDAEAGSWLYIGPDLRVEIARRTEKKLLWYEADIRCREGVAFTPVLAEGSREAGHNFIDPFTLAEESGAVFAVTDDNYGERWYRTNVEEKKGYYEGAVIRDGEIRADILPPEKYTKFPSLDVMAWYPDGTVEMYDARAHTAQEYLDMGAVNTWAFGPILLRDGQPNDLVFDQTKLSYEGHMEKAPRMAMGYYEKGHYVFLCAVGRSAKSEGATLPWLIERMQQLGVKDGFNLDGGQTAVMCFMGKSVNKSPAIDRETLRKVSSMIGIGTAGQ